MTDETTAAIPTFDPTWLRGQPVAKWADMFGMPQDVNDAEDEGEAQRDDVIARLTAERDRARATAVQLEDELARSLKIPTRPMDEPLAFGAMVTAEDNTGVRRAYVRAGPFDYPWIDGEWNWMSWSQLRDPRPLPIAEATP